MAFTFVKPIMHHLLEDFPGFLDGIARIVAVWHEKETLQACIKTSKKTEAIDLEDFKDDILKLMLQKQPYNWLDVDSLPFSPYRSDLVQLKIFKEIEKTILLLRIPNGSKHSDLLFLHFDKGLTHLNIVKNGELKLTSENKAIIGNLYQQFLQAIIENTRKNKAFLKTTLNPQTHNIINFYETLKKDYQALRTKHNEMLERFVKSLYEKYLPNCEQITLEMSAISKLDAFKGNVDELEQIVKNSVDYIQAIYLDGIPENLEIKDYLINTNIELEQPERQVSNQQNTIEDWLDGLHQAVKELLAENEKVTVKKVIDKMGTEVSNASVTDRVKSQADTIRRLFKRHPNRWVELKQHFSPIQNWIKINDVEIQKTG